MTDMAHALRDTLLALTRIPSPIGEEAELCDHVEERLSASLGAETITRFHDSLIVHAAQRKDAPRIALVGHLDTVRTRHDGPPRVEGNRLYGAGAADMKSGLAIMIELVERMDLSALPCDLTLIFYEREEGPFEENRLGPILDTHPDLHELDLAVCLEPSDNQMQLGAMGSIHATLTFMGRTAHSARPWQGENALYKVANFIAALERREPHDVELDGYVFREVMTPTVVQGGGPRNVVPGEAELNVNYRFAPGRTPEEAFAELRELAGEECKIHATDLSPAGHPHASDRYIQHLMRCGVNGVRSKQAWTDVARFDAIGVPGVNLGPGTAAQAHQPNEYTELDHLLEGYAIFERFFEKTVDNPLY
ncbi:MAG: succinyl-diaminopimelate desuccinylase [Polyangiales bacterium]